MPRDRTGGHSVTLAYSYIFFITLFLLPASHYMFQGSLLLEDNSWPEANEDQKVIQGQKNVFEYVENVRRLEGYEGADHGKPCRKRK